MGKQLSLAVGGFEAYRKATRRDVFLSEMDRVIPWGELCGVIEPYYPKEPEGAGRRPLGLEKMLRIYFLQHFYDLSDPAMEEMLYDSVSMRRFVGIDLGREPAPDETTICKFRHLLERHSLGDSLFAQVLGYLQGRGFKVSTGTIVDATIIRAPDSIKNKAKARDPEMHSTRKGMQWYFGMKGHVGVDSRTQLIHSVAATAANVSDCKLLPDLLHGHETRVWGDSAYTGQTGVIRQVAPKARDFTHRPAVRNHPLTPDQRAANRTKARVRARGEHPFLVLKRIFGFAKVRYRGLLKNAHRLVVACALVNLYRFRRPLLRVAWA